METDTLVRRMRTRFVGVRAVLFGIVTGLLASATAAHEGPPFPILMDQLAGDHIVSVWADPDVGDSLFFVVIESSVGGMPNDAPRVSLWVEPVSGRLERSVYNASRLSLRSQMQFEAKPRFDRQDIWTVGVELVASDGERRTLTMQVESTPPGYGPWDLAIYFFPFLLLGGLWIAAMVRRLKRNQKTTRPQY